MANLKRKFSQFSTSSFELSEGRCRTSVWGGRVAYLVISLPSGGHAHSAASSSERREPRLDRGGLRLGERVAVEVQRLQRRQRSHRVGKCHELVVEEEQLR